MKLILIPTLLVHFSLLAQTDKLDEFFFGLPKNVNRTYVSGYMTNRPEFPESAKLNFADMFIVNPHTYHNFLIFPKEYGQTEFSIVYYTEGEKIGYSRMKSIKLIYDLSDKELAKVQFDKLLSYFKSFPDVVISPKRLYETGYAHYFIFDNCEYFALEIAAHKELRKEKTQYIVSTTIIEDEDWELLEWKD